MLFRSNNGRIKMKKQPALWILLQVSISHSHRRNKRRFDPNVQKKTYWVPSLRRKVTLNMSAKGIKVIDVRGIDAVVADIIARGEKI